MECFICNTGLTLNSTSKHFKLVHNTIDTFRCTYDNNCGQFISSLSKFIRHFKVHIQGDFKSGKNRIDVKTPTLFEYSESEGISQECSSENVPLFPSKNYIPLIHLEKAAEMSPDIGVKFALELHNNANFNRRDVLSIQNNVMNNIINPIFQNNKQFVEQNLSLDVNQSLQFSAMFENINNPFKTCETEYKLEGWLKANDYIHNFEEFTINSEIGPLYRKDEMQYDTVEILGALLLCVLFISSN